MRSWGRQARVRACGVTLDPQARMQTHPGTPAPSHLCSSHIRGNTWECQQGTHGHTAHKLELWLLGAVGLVWTSDTSGVPCFQHLFLP